MEAIRRNIFNMIPDDKQFVKAFSLAIFIKHKFVSSTVTNFSFNKLHKITGLHSVTLKKRIRVLKNLGFIEYIGRNNEHLVVKSMSSHNKLRNIDLSNIVFDTIKDIEKSLLTLIVVEIQKRKNYVKQIINAFVNPKTTKQYKAARRKCRLFGYGHQYNEYGISYKRIAREMGVGIQKAVKIIKFAVKYKFLEIIHRQEQEFCYGIKLIDKYDGKKDYTFCTKNNKYTIFANEYVLGSRVTLCGIY